MDKDIPRVSIGIPVYNGEKYLSQAIDAILNQSYKDLELIVSDNASTDGTQAICEGYVRKDPRVKYYRNEKNLGAAPNYNRVFELSKGEYFKWADYDDLIAPDFVSTCVEVLDKNPEVVLCYPEAIIIDQNGDSLGKHDYKIKLDSPDPKVRFQQLVLHPATAFEVSGLIRAEIIKHTGLHGSFPASDLVFLAELAFYGPFYEIPRPLFYPRYHPAQSARLIPVERDRVLFFDTSYEGKITLPKWQYLVAYLRAIKRSQLGFSQQMYCYFQMLRWAFIPDHFRALGKDVFLAVNRLIGRQISNVMKRPGESFKV